MEYLYYHQRIHKKMTKQDSETRKNYTNIHPSKSIDGDSIKVGEKNYKQELFNTLSNKNKFKKDIDRIDPNPKKEKKLELKI